MNLIPKIEGEHFMVHSTNLRNHTVEGLHLKPKNDLAKVTGPAILLPRVGNPKSTKMCVIDGEVTYVLSDCVMAIKFSDIREARILFRYLQDNWQMVADLYTGTGARYITVEKLMQFLNLDLLNFEFPSSQAI
ncbi:MAG: hypothetical protein EOO20_09095 [Chryseobacterium sp.]|nr:MAG: hypothetical protein EOO20_09095 [Chryseobacterium sp.]